MKKTVKNDILLVGGLLLLSLAAFLFWRLKEAPGKTAVVRLNGEITARYLLSENGRYLLNEGGNVLVIRDGCAFMESADCPDKICADHARIHYDHETIVCLPHKLVVEIKGGEESDIDVKTN